MAPAHRNGCIVERIQGRVQNEYFLSKYVLRFSFLTLTLLSSDANSWSQDSLKKRGKKSEDLIFGSESGNGVREEIKSL